MSAFQTTAQKPNRWFRYSAGFSAQWVNKLLLQERKKGINNILDPFVGSGTVSIESIKLNLNTKRPENQFSGLNIFIQNIPD